MRCPESGLGLAQAQYYSGTLRKPRTTSGAPEASQRQMTRYLLILSVLVFLTCVCLSAQSNQPPANKAWQAAAAEANSVLPHDGHDGLTVSADPYVDKARGKEKFGKANPLEAGILPVEVFLRNDTQAPIQVNINTIQLEVRLRKGGKQDVDWLSAADVAALIAHPGGVAPSQPRRVAGIPLPSGDKKADKLTEILQPFTLDADTVPPMHTLHGFLFFDVNHDTSLASTAVLYIPDVVQIPSKKALMFFEVNLAKPAEP